MYPSTLREEELKNKVAADVFGDYDCTRILGAVDFCVSPKTIGPQLIEPESLLWAEAKTGVRDDFAPLFAQLVLTLGKARTFDRHLPPPFLGAFDCARIAFVPYHEVVDLFYQNDFNWNVAPSDETTREFGLVLDRVRPLLDASLRVFRFDEDAIELDAFVRKALRQSADGQAASLNVTRNNFVFVYQKWARDVKPSIAVDWDGAKKAGILDADFFLADLLSKDGATLVEKLYVVLRGNHYELDRRLDAFGFLDAKRAGFNDGQKAHTLFWNRYRRPPKKEYWGYISERRDLLVPQDVRERKGSFFTPQIWVEKAQEALAAVLGENWQDEYDVWDCAAGTGNLLAGLQNKYRVWASTLDRADVEVMRERIKNGANLLDSHVFPFDFLNGSFDDLPEGLRAIVRDPERRKKLVVFINPPYAEAGNKGQMTARGKNKSGVTFENATYEKYHERLGTAARELAALFLTRIYCEIPGCVIGCFTKLKIIQSVNFKGFRDIFQPELKSLFVVPANTFDNVKGEFPIGFFVWNGSLKERFSNIAATVIKPSKQSCEVAGQKTFCCYDFAKFMLHWIRQYFDKTGDLLAYIRVNGQDMQNRNGVFLTLSLTQNDVDNHFFFRITRSNFLSMAVYFAVRHCIEADWLNDRDQFLWPADTWETDGEFQLDCLVFTLFHGQNRISCRAGGILAAKDAKNAEDLCEPLRSLRLNNSPVPPPVNHWIPFPESEVDAKDAYKSHFMVDFLSGRASNLSTTAAGDLFAAAGDVQMCKCANVANSQYPIPNWEMATMGTGNTSTIPHFSPEAKTVLDAGRRLWRHYHAQPGALPDASFYDIRAHFQGFKPNGHMNPDSPDAEYTRLIGDLRAAMKELAAKIAPKVREHGFLR